ncbi:MAG: Wzt carbohydrate-binding domain-containing protein [Verrucomicrobiota bacterium]
MDEILAVGDYGFQQKCVARLRQMRDNGLTLLFVSHSPDTIKSICNRGLFLLGGKTAFCGSAEQAVNLYFNYIREQTNADALIAQKDLQKPVEFQSQVSGALRYGTGHVQIEKAELSDRHGQPTRAFRFGEEVRLHVWYRAHIATTNLSISFVVRDTAGIDLMGTTTFDERVILPSVGKEEQGKVSFSFLNQLRSGSYGVCVSINRVKERDYSDNVLFDQIDSCAAFVIIPDPNRPVHYKFSCPIQIKIGSVAEKEHSLHIANN